MRDAIAFRSLAIALAVATVPAAASAQQSPAPAAAPNEDPAVTKTATALVAQAQTGKIDRTQFDDKMNAALTDDYVAKGKDQLGPLGPAKTVTFTGQAMSGTVHIYRYRIDFASQSLIELIAIDADGKIGGWRFRPTADATPGPEENTVPHSIAQPNRLGAS